MTGRLKAVQAAGTSLGVSRRFGRHELLAWLRAFRGCLPPDMTFDRDEPNWR